MRHARPVLFYTVVAIFAATALVTLLGITGAIEIPEAYLNALFAALLIELIAAVVGLFKATDWFGRRGPAEEIGEIEGGWWQLVQSADQPNALSYVRISYSEDRQQLVLEGEAFTAGGARYARWWSIAGSLNPATWKIHYFWRGDHPADDRDFSGIGCIRFDQGRKRATGWFTQGDIDRLQITGRRKTEMIRASRDEERAMAAGDTAARAELISSIYASWKPSAPTAPITPKVPPEATPA